MTYFANVKSYEDLKAQYRTLALANHPDAGGNTEVMQKINAEYDQLFIIWKHRSNIENNETAASTRSEFYTAYGYKGENYNRSLSLKEIACLIREFIKIHYNDCKFSVTTSYASMCQELHISLMEGPCKAFKSREEWTEEEQDEAMRITAKLEYMNYSESQLESQLNEAFMTDYIKEAVKAVEDYAKSFNYDDSDAQIDYFDTNFYFFGVKIGTWDKEYKIVERTKKTVPNVEYETVEVTKTRTIKELEPRDIEKPKSFEKGQMFQMKANFNYGCFKGSVYQIVSVSEGGFITGHRMGRRYKKVKNGNGRGDSFNTTIDRLNNWIDKGAICFVELVEVTKTEEYTSAVRRPKKQTGISTEVRPASDTENITQDTPEAAGAKEYTITEDADTRDNSALWVVKFVDCMNREEYKQTAALIKTAGGWYSKFKKGFIFRFDPTEKLEELYSATKQEQTQEQEETEPNTNIQNNIKEEREENNMNESDNKTNIVEATGEIQETEPETNVSILDKFAAVEVTAVDRFPSDDMEFCKDAENLYNLAHALHTEIYNKAKKFMDEYETSTYGDYFTQYGDHSRSAGLSHYKSNIERDTEIFINKVCYYFRDKYNVTLESPKWENTTGESYNQRKETRLDIVPLDFILDSIHEQMGGMSFDEKALNEAKQGMKSRFYNEYQNKWHLDIKGNKIIMESFYSSYKDSIWKQYEVSVNESHTAFFEALTHFEYGEVYLHQKYNAFTGHYKIREDTGIYDKHMISSTVINSIKVLKNGKVEIEFKDSQKAKLFTKEYCGYIDQAA